MSIHTKVALYPIFADTLPVARYLMKYRHDIEVVELLAPKGSCVCGIDAGYLDNREYLGITVRAYDQANVNSWDELYILRHETIGLTQDMYIQMVYEPMIRIAQEAKRKIIGYPFPLDDEVNNPELTSSVHENSTFKKHGMVKQIKTFMVFVGGVIAEANAFEVFLRLYGELQKSLHVVAFSSSINAEICGVFSLRSLLYGKQFTDEQKVFAIEKTISKICKDKKADIVLLQLDEALMPFSDTQTGGFGIIPYIVSQAVSPDHCICCLPYGYVTPSFLTQFEQGLEGRFAFSPDRWHMSNALLDYTTMTSIRDAGAIHVPMSLVENTLLSTRGNGVNIGCDVLPQYLAETVETIISAYGDARTVTSII